MKHICKRDLLRNAANSLSDEPTIVTKHGQPEYFVGKIDTVNSLKSTIDSLTAFQSSLDISGTDNVGQDFSHMGDYSSIGIIQNEIDQNKQEIADTFFKTSGHHMKGLRTFVSSKPTITKGGKIKYEKHSHK